MATVNYMCGVCSILIKENASSVLCVTCDNWIHAKCTKLSTRDFNKLATKINKSGLEWTCDICKDKSKEDNRNISGIDNTSVVNHLEGMLQKCFEKYFIPFKEQMESNHKVIKSEISKLSKQYDDVIKRCTLLEERVNTIELKVNNPDCEISSSESVISEILDRNRRTKNVVVFNLPESQKLNGFDRLNDDRASIAEVISSDFSDSLKNFKLRRIGRPKAGKIRPLRIETACESDAKLLLKTKTSFESKIRFSSDQTPAQQLQLKHRRSELDTLVQDGITNKTIKYINGCPQIVNKTFRKEAESDSSK